MSFRHPVEFFHCPLEVLKFKRLGYVIEGTQSRRFINAVPVLKRGHHYNTNIFIMRLYVFQERNAVHAFHLYVDQGKLRLLFFDYRKGVLSAECGEYLVPPLRQKIANKIANIMFVVNDQYFTHG